MLISHSLRTITLASVVASLASTASLVFLATASCSASPNWRTRSLCFFEFRWFSYAEHQLKLIIWNPSSQCCGSMTFWCGSGSFYFHHGPSRWQQKTNFFITFFCILLLEGTFTLFPKIKSKKKSHKTVKNQGFSYHSCCMIAGSGSGSTPLTNGFGSGSGRPKNMWIRIRNTAGSIKIFGKFREVALPFLLVKCFLQAIQ